MLFSSCNFTIKTLKGILVEVKGILVEVTILVFSVLASLNSIEPACGCGESVSCDGMELAVVGDPMATASSKLLRGFWRWTTSFTSPDRQVQLRTVVEFQV